ncbi:MAG: hypothetical protein WBO77_03445 [Microgenomates group bacterium]
MIPLLLVTDDEKKAQKYISDVKKKLGIHDAHVLTARKDGTQLKIDLIREINKQVSRLGDTPLLVCIFDFETAKSESQNTLLKTLEESLPSSQFILVSSDESAVLPTILSRVQTVFLEKKVRKSTPITLDKSLGVLLTTYDGMQKKPEKAVAFCDELLLHMQTTLHEHALTNKPTQKIAQLISEIISTRTLIMKNNISPQLAVDHLLIFYSGNVQSRYVPK